MVACCDHLQLHLLQHVHTAMLQPLLHTGLYPTGLHAAGVPSEFRCHRTSFGAKAAGGKGCGCGWGGVGWREVVGCEGGWMWVGWGVGGVGWGGVGEGVGAGVGGGWVGGWGMGGGCLHKAATCQTMPAELLRYTVS